MTKGKIIGNLIWDSIGYAIGLLLVVTGFVELAIFMIIIGFFIMNTRGIFEALKGAEEAADEYDREHYYMKTVNRGKMKFVVAVIVALLGVVLVPIAIIRNIVCLATKNYIDA